MEMATQRSGIKSIPLLAEAHQIKSRVTILPKDSSSLIPTSENLLKTASSPKTSNTQNSKYQLRKGTMIESKMNPDLKQLLIRMYEQQK